MKYIVVITALLSGCAPANGAGDPLRCEGMLDSSARELLLDCVEAAAAEDCAAGTGEVNLDVWRETDDPLENDAYVAYCDSYCDSGCSPDLDYAIGEFTCANICQAY